jgi:perosamine synthetase
MVTDIICHSKTTICDYDINSVIDVIRQGRSMAGSENRIFRSNIAEFLEKDNVFLFSSGSMALYHILLALEVKKGDDILLPTYVCSSVSKAIEAVGATCVFYDNAENSWLSAYQEIKKRITKNTKAIIVVHIFGIRFNDVEKMCDLNIPIIEDCAHAFSSRINKQPISTFSLCSFYSFNATKLLAAGEGGAVASDNKYFMNALENRILDCGLSDLNCAFGNAQLKQYSSFLNKRKEIANYYFEHLGGIAKELKLLDSLYFRFPVLVSNPVSYLFDRTILYKRGVDCLLHKAYQTKNNVFINSEKVFEQTVSVPIYPSLTQHELKKIVEDVVKKYCEKN